jgi:hypothetical protein
MSLVTFQPREGILKSRIVVEPGGILESRVAEIPSDILGGYIVGVLSSTLIVESVRYSVVFAI